MYRSGQRRQYDLEGVHRKLERIILMFSHIINFRVQVHSPLKAFISNHILCRCASFFSYRIRKYAPAHFFFSVLFSIKYICKGVELTRRALCCCQFRDKHPTQFLAVASSVKMMERGRKTWQQKQKFDGGWKQNRKKIERMRLKNSSIIFAFI